MSEAANLLNSSRQIYLRLIPHLRAAGAVGGSTTVGGLLLGPPGALAGGVVGAAGYVWAEQVVASLRAALAVLRGNPILCSTVLILIGGLTLYIKMCQQEEAQKQIGYGKHKEL